MAKYRARKGSLTLRKSIRHLVEMLHYKFLFFTLSAFPKVITFREGRRKGLTRKERGKQGKGKGVRVRIWFFRSREDSNRRLESSIFFRLNFVVVNIY